MENKKNILLTMSIIIIIAFTMLLFFGIGDSNKSGIQISAFCFIIIDEILIYINALMLPNSRLNTFSRAGLSSTVFIYSIVSLFINICLYRIFSNVKGILVFNFAILLIYLFINTIIFLFKKEEK